MKLSLITSTFKLFFSLLFCTLFTNNVLIAQNNTVDIALSAVLNQTQIELTWKNQTDNEIDYFTIERSLDGQNWETLVQMESNSKMAPNQHYQTVDAAPYEGTSFYRLGATNYEEVVLFSSAVEVIYEVSMDKFFMSQDKAVTKMRKSY